MRLVRHRIRPVGPAVLAVLLAAALAPSAPALASPSGINPNAAAAGSVPGGFSGDAARSAAGDAGTRFAQMRAGAVGAAATAHDDYGVFPHHVATGAIATQSIDTTVNIPASDTFYTPTLLSGRTGCFEVTTIYTGGHRQLGAWNWCANKPGFDKIINLDASFVSTYTANVHGRHAYTVKVAHTNAKTNEWTGYLYNHRTKKFNTFFTSKGKTHLSGQDTGWDMWEIYTTINGTTHNGNYCPAVKGHSFESSDIQFWIDGGWHKTNASNIYWSPSQHPDPGKDFHCPSLKFTSNPNDWIVAG